MPAVSVRPRVDAHFLAGFEHLRAGRSNDARREWNACRELDETHDFCEFGLSVLDAAAPKAETEQLPVTSVPPAGVGSDPTREAQQAYLEGVIYYQKGNYEKAATSWRKAKELAPREQAGMDAQIGLEKIAKLGIGATPSSLKAAPEKKDEHEALQTYFTGLIYYQKGDLVRARTEWMRAKALAPEGSSVMSDAKAALEKLDKDEASTRGDRKK